MWCTRSTRWDSGRLKLHFMHPPPAPTQPVQAGRHPQRMMLPTRSQTQPEPPAPSFLPCPPHLSFPPSLHCFESRARPPARLTLLLNWGSWGLGGGLRGASHSCSWCRWVQPQYVSLDHPQSHAAARLAGCGVPPIGQPPYLARHAGQKGLDCGWGPLGSRCTPGGLMPAHMHCWCSSHSTPQMPCTEAALPQTTPGPHEQCYGSRPPALPLSAA